jgi:hypothetical protein
MITPGKPFISNYKYTIYPDSKINRRIRFKEIEAWAFSNKIRMKMKDDERAGKITVFFEDDMDFSAFKLVFPV